MPRKANTRVVDYLSTARSFDVLSNVSDHAEFLTLAHRVADQYLAYYEQEVEWAGQQFREIIALELKGSDAVDERESFLANPTAVQRAFAPVAEFFIDSPEAVLKIIADNNGTIRLTRLLQYEAACILNPLRWHFERSKRNAFKVKVEIQGEEILYWMRDRNLHHSYQNAKERAEHWERFSELEQEQG